MTPTPRDRLLAAVRGKVLDRPPFAVWRHFPEVEGPGRARALAETLVAFVERHQLDLLKYNPRAAYHAEPWTSQPTSWAAIDRRPRESGVFLEMLEGLRLAREALPHVPILMTIFTPLAVLERIRGHERLRADLRSRPEEVVPALEAVTETFAAFARDCLRVGIDGVFLATTRWARRDVLDDGEYARFGRPYDLRVLETVPDAPFNVVHVCGPQARVVELADYPVAGVSWNAHAPGNPGVWDLLRTVPDRVAIGGLSDDAFTDASPARLGWDGNAVPAHAFGRWVAAGGCTIPLTSRERSIDLAREHVLMRGGYAWTR